MGYRAWGVDPSSEQIDREAIEAGIRQGREELRSRIFTATWQELSQRDREFLEAMLEDEGESRSAELKERLGWSSPMLSQYRRRLIEAGIIASRGRGAVAFELPYFREFLEEELS